MTKEDVTVTVCIECDGSNEIRLVGKEYLSHCSACGTIEGRTEDISEEEWERRNQ